MPVKTKANEEKLSLSDVQSLKNFVNDLIEELNNGNLNQSQRDKQYQLIGATIHSIYNNEQSNKVDKETQTDLVLKKESQTQTQETSNIKESPNFVPSIPKELSNSRFDHLNLSFEKFNFNDSFAKERAKSEGLPQRKKPCYTKPTTNSEIRDKKNSKIRIKKSKSMTNLSSLSKSWDISRPISPDHSFYINSQNNLSESLFAQLSDYSSDEERSLLEKSKCFDYREGSYSTINQSPSGSVRKFPNHPAHETSLCGSAVLYKADMENSR